MQDLPLAALRLPGEMLATLADLGLVSIGDVLLLDREQLRSRFGPSLLLRIDQFLGAVAEVFAAVDPPEQFVVEQSFEHPIKHSDAIRGSVERLLERLAWWLAARDAGALEIACRLACEDGTATELTFGVFQPTASAQRLLEIADLQLERLRLAAPVQGIELCVLRHARLEQRQGTLFESQRTLDGSLQLTGLIDRLSGRLGRQAVVRCRIVSDAQPELAYREEPLVGSAPPSAPGGRSRMHSRRSPLARPRKPAVPTRAEPPAKGALDRPLCLLARPVPLEMASVVPQGPPIRFRFQGEHHEIAKQWGPERIETGWWRRQRAVRDYYRVETAAGRRFWLFRRRDDRWFLHGGYE